MATYIDVVIVLMLGLSCIVSLSLVYCRNK